MKAKVLVVYYSLYGHVYRLAEAAAEGARSVQDVEAVLRRVPETLPPDVLEGMGAVEAQKQQAHVPVCSVEELAEADAIIFGAPTRFGSMCGQLTVSGRDRATMDERGVGRESWKRDHEHRYTT